MSYRGAMDGWHGDETLCHVNCGYCDKCIEQYEVLCDAEYQYGRDMDIGMSIQQKEDNHEYFN